MAFLMLLEDQQRLNFNVHQVEEMEKALGSLEDLAFQYRNLGFCTKFLEKEFHTLSCAIDELNQENAEILKSPRCRSIRDDYGYHG